MVCESVTLVQDCQAPVIELYEKKPPTGVGVSGLESMDCGSQLVTAQQGVGE